MTWSPDTMQKRVFLSVMTSPNMTGMMPRSVSLLRGSSLSTTSLPPSATKQDPMGTETAGMSLARSSSTTMALSSLVSHMTLAMAGIWESFS